MIKMPTACRVAIGSLWKDGTIAHAAHAGLILDKFLQSQRDDTAKEDGIQDRENLFKTAISACNAVTDIYAEAFSRYSTALLEMCVCAKFVTKNRLIVGFGGENVLESGITLHKTFGTPILSGSPSKGLHPIIVIRCGDRRIHNSGSAVSIIGFCLERRMRPGILPFMTGG
jgi:CRISPR/Cas system CMR subunit Cmr6 (Cas7 group RAMP superfamily)